MDNTRSGVVLDSAHPEFNDSVPLCPVCQAKPVRSHEQIFMAKYRVVFHQCPGCGLLRSQPPTWLDAAYSNAIAQTDVGLLSRNIEIARLLKVLFAFRLGAEERILDYAGGYGLLVRLLRDAGYAAHWYDQYCKNIFATGYEASPDSHFPVITLIEVLEHIHDPVAFLDTIMATCRPRMLIISTLTYAGTPPAPGTWDYYSPETGQHITFYTEQTLDLLAQRYGLVSQRLGMIRVFAAPGSVPGWMRFFAHRRMIPLWKLGCKRRQSLLMQDYAAARKSTMDGG